MSAAGFWGLFLAGALTGAATVAAFVRVLHHPAPVSRAEAQLRALRRVWIRGSR